VPQVINRLAERSIIASIGLQAKPTRQVFLAHFALAPARNLEGLVIDRLRAFLDDPVAVLDALTDELHGGIGRTELIKRSRQLAEELQAKAPTMVKTLLMRLLCIRTLFEHPIFAPVTRPVET
jgi:hypothetical protein